MGNIPERDDALELISISREEYGGFTERAMALVEEKLVEMGLV